MKRSGPELRARAQRIRLRRERREQMRQAKRTAKRLRREFALEARRLHAAQNGIIFDTNLAREQIILPAVFSLHDNYEPTMEVVTRMRDVALRENRPVMLHFTAVDQVDAAATLVLVAEIHRIRNLRSIHAVYGTYPVKRVIYELLKDMGFYNVLNISERKDVPEPQPDPSRPAFLRFLTSNRAEPAMVDTFVGILETHLFQMNELARTRLVGAISEAISNTLDHAHPKASSRNDMRHRWWMSSWINVMSNEVTVMLFDQGVGIPNTLDPNLYDRIRSVLTGSLLRLSTRPTDGELILAATEIHRTQTGQSGRGRGFRDMKRFIETCSDGELRVLSNRGRYRYVKGTESCADASSSLGGTVIEWRFRHDGSVEMKDD